MTKTIFHRWHTGVMHRGPRHPGPRHPGLLAVSGIALMLLAGCGSKPQEPVEQVIVNAPGAAATATNGDTLAAAGSSLVATGKTAAATCLACHAVAAGAASMVGPNLHGVVGRKAGSLGGFAYSTALKTSGLTWTDAELDAFLANPTGKVPGTAMAYAVQDAATRKAIIAYLGSISPQ